MIPYYGRNFAKQYIKGKPIRFGCKNWALHSSTGFVYAFDIYVGKSQTDNPSKELGAGGDVVMKLLHKANVPADAGQKLYCDNYFTLHKLLDHLSSKGFCATGTARENRLLNCLLHKKETFRKKPRFSSESAGTSSVTVMKHRDNNVVSLPSNFDCDAIGTKRIYSCERKCEISVHQPTAVHNYNQHMGGVNQLDQSVVAYRTRMRQKKWWWPIFIYFFDITIVKAWMLWRKKKENRNVQRLSFRR